MKKCCAIFQVHTEFLNVIHISYGFKELTGVYDLRFSYVQLSVHTIWLQYHLSFSWSDKGRIISCIYPSRIPQGTKRNEDKDDNWFYIKTKVQISCILSRNLNYNSDSQAFQSEKKALVCTNN
jgi:hypothetical protein